MLKKIFLLLPVLLMIAFGCERRTRPPEAPQKPLLLTSIAPYQFLVRQVAGDGFEVQTIAPSSANPHAFEPTSRQVSGIARGTVWFRIGEPFEEKLLPFLKERMEICDLREGIPLLKHSGCLCDPSSRDRHIWLSPKRASLQAAAIEQMLSARFPDQKERFRKNLIVLQGQLAMLDIEIGALLAPVKDRVLLVSHPAFGYFCEDYSFQQLSVEVDGKDPRPRHLEETLRQAAERHADVALALPQYNNRGTELLAEKLRVPVHLLDPYSADYFTTMRQLARLAGKALPKESPKDPDVSLRH